METKKLNTAFDLFAGQVINDGEFIAKLEKANPKIEFRIIPGGRKWTPPQVIRALKEHSLNHTRIKLIKQITQYGKNN